MQFNPLTYARYWLTGFMLVIWLVWHTDDERKVGGDA